jgi:hypothetical protein
LFIYCAAPKNHTDFLYTTPAKLCQAFLKNFAKICEKTTVFRHVPLRSSARLRKPHRFSLYHNPQNFVKRFSKISQKFAKKRLFSGTSPCGHPRGPENRTDSLYTTPAKSCQAFLENFAKICEKTTVSGDI